MAVEHERKASRPSLYAAIRLASLVQHFRDLLKARVKSKAQFLKEQCQEFSNNARDRLSGVANLRDCQRKLEKHTDEYCQPTIGTPNRGFLILLQHLDCHSAFGGVRLSRVAAHDHLLLQHNIHLIVAKSNVKKAGHILDLATLLLTRLHFVNAEKLDVPTGYAAVEIIKYKNFVANLEHLLLCLQQAALQAFIGHSVHLLEAEILHWQKRREHWQSRRRRDDDWFSEWPNGRRPLSTTWPWNIKPSLVVLWGVCWMFYYRNPAPTQALRGGRLPKQQIPKNNGFVSTTSASRNPTILPWHSLESGGQLTGPALSEDPSNHVIGYQPSGPGLAYSGESGISEYRSSSVSSPYIDPPASSPPVPVGNSTHIWPLIQGIVTTPREVSHNDWQPRQNPISISTSTPQLSYSASTINPFADEYQLLSASTVTSGFFDLTPGFVASTNLSVPMQDSHNYPTPHSDGSDRASSLCSIMPSNLSPALQPTRSPSTDEVSTFSHLHSTTDASPPRNDQGQITCVYEECVSDPPVFSRRCEWTKHMDKHTRPYICHELGCEKIQGFTYSGGLHRHQREVHKQHGGPKAPRMCPHQDCKRSSGTGFSRKENLNEHLRRVHRGFGIEKSDADTRSPGLYHDLDQMQQQRQQQSQTQILAPGQASMLGQVQGQRKRPRMKEDATELTTEETLQARVRQLERDLQERDTKIRTLEAVIQRIVTGQLRST